MGKQENTEKREKGTWKTTQTGKQTRKRMGKQDNTEERKGDKGRYSQGTDEGKDRKIRKY